MQSTIATNQSSLIESQEDKILDIETDSPLLQYSETDSGCESDKADGKSKHGKKRKGYPKEITKVLNDWFFANLQNPYPSEDEKKELVNQTTLSLLQINNWFSNKRVRYKRKMQKEGQEVVEGGVDINQAFRSIKKQKDKKEQTSTSTTTSNTTSQTPKRKRSSATKDMQYTKKKRPTPLKVEPTTPSLGAKESSSPLIKTPSQATPIITNSPTVVSTSTAAVVQEPKNVLSSLLESPSNMNMNGNSVVLLRSPIINNEETKKTPDEKSTESPQPKQIDFFQSLQQAGVLFPQNTMTTPVIPVIQTMPTYHPYVVHNAAPMSTPFVDAITVPYGYPIYTPTYYPNHQVIFMNKQVDDSNFFEMDGTFSAENELDVQFEDAQGSELFHHDLFSGEQEEAFDSHQWNSTNEDLLF